MPVVVGLPSRTVVGVQPECRAGRALGVSAAHLCMRIEPMPINRAPMNVLVRVMQASYVSAHMMCCALMIHRMHDVIVG